MGIRKNQRNLSVAEKTAFVNAVRQLKRNGRYDPFVQQHIDRIMNDSDDGVRTGHRSPSFLPWHRKFLLEFERELQAIDSSVNLPYWDWTTDRSTSPMWGNDFMGPNGTESQNGRVMSGPFAGWRLTVRSDSATYLRRTFGAGVSLPTASNVSTVLGIAVYDTAPWNSTSGGSFRNNLEGFRGPNLHNRVHNWVSGTMAGAGSNNDPVFWLHHCFVDKLWADWQQNHPGQIYLPGAGTPNVVDLDEPMPPWGGTVTPRSMLDHTQWYAYQ